MAQFLPLAIGMPGGYEWIIVGVVALLLFGKRLPSVARSLGQAMHEFKSGLAGKLDETESGAAEDAQKTGSAEEGADKK